MHVAVNEEHVSEVQRWAERLSQSYLYCRTFGHTWKPWTARWVPEERCYEQIIRCSRCKNERFQLLNRYGEVVKNWYRYPHGYLHKALGRITGEGKGALRLEALKRQIAKPPSQE
jgi:hypothetical protein